MDIDFVAWAAVLGAFLPPVISFFRENANIPFIPDHMESQVKKYFAMAVSVVVAVLYVAVKQGGFPTWQDAMLSVAIVIPLAQTTYTGFWEGTELEKWLGERGKKQ